MTLVRQALNHVSVFKAKCSVTILLFARNKWILNKRRTRITENLTNAAAFNLIA